MSERKSYAPGVPCWIDLTVQDSAAATGFYSTLFGWRAGFEAEPEAHGYGFFHFKGKRVAGVAPLAREGEQATWNSYVAVADVEATTRRAREAGGEVVVPPTQVLQAGSMAAIRDLEGAYLLLWQAGQQPGCELVNEPGTFCWSELNTRDPARALEFYPEVFGWESGGDAHYTQWKIDGKKIAGMIPMALDVTIEDPAYWLVYFAVDDVEESTAKAEDLGGHRLSPFIDSPNGRISVMEDRWKARFGLISGLQEHH